MGDSNGDPIIRFRLLHQRPLDDTLGLGIQRTSRLVQIAIPCQNASPMPA